MLTSMEDATATCFTKYSTSCPVMSGSTSANPKSSARPLRDDWTEHNTERLDISAAKNGGELSRGSAMVKMRSTVPEKLSEEGGVASSSSSFGGRSWGGGLPLLPT